MKYMKMISAAIVFFLLGAIALISNIDFTLKEAQDKLKSWYDEIVVKDNPMPKKLLKEEPKANKKERLYELR